MLIGVKRLSSRDAVTRAVDPFRKSGTRICCDAQRKSYGVFLPQQRMERIAIERVLAAKCSLENRPYGGEAQVVSGVGRPAFKVHEPSSAQPQRLCGALEARKTRKILVGRAPITTKQFVEDLKAAFC